jgi:hypothetical protein
MLFKILNESGICDEKSRDQDTQLLSSLHQTMFRKIDTILKIRYLDKILNTIVYIPCIQSLVLCFYCLCLRCRELLQ